MERYIEQLTADFRESALNVCALHADKKHPDNIEQLEAELEQAVYIRLGDYLNLQKEQFPPVNRLNKLQLQLIEVEFANLLRSYGFLLHFPKGVLLTLKYQTFIEVLSRDVPILPSFFWHVATCEYEPKSCPFGSQHCSCFI